MLVDSVYCSFCCTILNKCIELVDTRDFTAVLCFIDLDKLHDDFSDKHKYNAEKESIDRRGTFQCANLILQIVFSQAGGFYQFASKMIELSHGKNT